MITFYYKQTVSGLMVESFSFNRLYHKTFMGYSMKEVKRKVREETGLKYKRNVEFIHY